jgi:hypothetical protein
MKKFVIAGALIGALGIGGAAFAKQTPPAQPKKPAAPAAQPAQPQAETPAPAKRARRTTSASENAKEGHAAPKPQPPTTEAPNATDTAMVLGMVHLPKAVKADGKELAAGTYQVRLTAEEAKPDAKGSSEVLERWVEFVQKGQVKGREVVSIVPAAESKLVQKDAPPPSGGAKVETLKGGDYLRVWLNKGGTYYLVHFAA